VQRQKKLEGYKGKLYRGKISRLRNVCRRKRECKVNCADAKKRLKTNKGRLCSGKKKPEVRFGGNCANAKKIEL